MMKSALLGLTLLSLPSAHAQDLILQSRLDERTLNGLLDQTRVVLKNNDIADQLTGRVDFDDEVRFSLEEITQSDNFRKFRDVFTSVFGVDLNKAEIRVKISKIDYHIPKVKVKPLSARVQDPILDLNFKTELEGLTTSIPEGLVLDLMIKDPKTGREGSFLNARVNPITLQLPANIEPVSFEVGFETKRGNGFEYQLKDYNLSAIPDLVNRNLNRFIINDTRRNAAFSADSISVDPVTITLNGMLKRTIYFDTFKPVIQKRMNSIVSTILSELGASIQSSIGPKILASVFNNNTRSDLVVESESIYTRFLTSNFSQPESNQISFGITGELCTTLQFKTFGNQCNQYNATPAPIRTFTSEESTAAISEISTSLREGSSDLVLSLSEEYLNRLLSTTIQADLWNEALAENHVKLGPKGAFMVLNRKTANPELFIDLLYFGEGKGIEKIMINPKRPLRFPLRISTAMEFKNQDQVPHLMIRTKEVVSSMNEIINGIPEYQLPSRLIPGLKKKIAKMILNMTKDMNGKTAVDLDLPVLKEINLNQTRIEASSFGRLNILYRF